MGRMQGVFYFLLLVVCFASSSPIPDASNVLECGQKAEGNNNTVVWPWLTTIFRNSASGLEFLCEGTLISRQYIVTAAHCLITFQENLQSLAIVVHVGRTNMGVWGESDTAKPYSAKLIPFQKYVYDDWNFENDIALLQLIEKVNITETTRPVCQMRPDELESSAGDEGHVVGWRKASLETEPGIIHKKAQFYSQQDCEEKHNDEGKVLKKNFCANFTGDTRAFNMKGTARPMFLLKHDKDGSSRWVLKGIMNIDIKTAYLFTNISYYQTWINNKAKWEDKFGLTKQDLEAESSRNLVEETCQKELPRQTKKFREDEIRFDKEIDELKENITKGREEEEKLRDLVKASMSDEQISILLYDICGILKSENLVKEAENLVKNIKDLPKKSEQIVKRTETFKSKYKSNALKEAIKSGDLAAVKCMIYEGGDINKTDSDGNTALHMAAQSNQLAIYIWLANRNNNYNLKATNNKQQTSLDIASKMCNVDSIKWMIKNVIPDMSTDGYTILQNAAQNSSYDTVKCILEHKMENAIHKNKDDYNSLHYAAMGGHCDSMKALLEDYGDNNLDVRNKEGETPMHLVAIGGYLECAKLLVNKGADYLKIPSYKGNTPFQEATHTANPVADFLIADAPTRKINIAHTDFSTNSRDTIDINIQDLNGNTVLHSAAQNGTAKMIQSLLNINADLFIKNNENKTPMDLSMNNTNVKFDEESKKNISIYEWLTELAGEV